MTSVEEVTFVTAMSEKTGSHITLHICWIRPVRPDLRVRDCRCQSSRAAEPLAKKQGKALDQYRELAGFIAGVARKACEASAHCWVSNTYLELLRSVYRFNNSQSALGFGSLTQHHYGSQMPHF